MSVGSNVASGTHSSPLGVEVMSDCVKHFNRAMQHIKSTLTSNASEVGDECVQPLPDDEGFVVRCGLRSELMLKFGRIEDCQCDGLGSVIALPANEFFDDECVTDSRSALGSFVLHHFDNQV